MSTLKDDLNITSSSASISLSEDNLTAGSEEENDLDDDEVRRMLLEGMTTYSLVGSLPPTPRPPSVSSLSSTPSPKKRAPVPCEKLARKGLKQKERAKKTERDICRDFGINIEDPDFEKLVDDRLDKNNEVDDDKKPNAADGMFIKPKPKPKKRNKPNVKDVVDDLIGMDLNSKGPKKSPKKRQDVKVKKEPKDKDPTSTRLDKRWTDLKFTSDDRCGVLKDDVDRVRKRKESIDALIGVLEKIREKVINDDENLVFTEPPHVLIKQAGSAMTK